MKHLVGLSLVLVGAALSFAPGCGGSDTSASGGGGPGGGTPSSSSSGSTSSSSGVGGSGSTSSGMTSSSGMATSSSSGSSGMVADPNLDGPYTITEIDDTKAVQATGDNVAIHCAYPTAGPTAGPYPVILFGHGFNLPPSQYFSYVKRLASFGYVALTVDYPANLGSGANNVKQAKDLIAGLDWAAQKPELNGKADVNKAGASGHSLGGKVSLLAATLEPRIKASIVLDPVDGSMFCNPTDCPDVSSLMPTLTIPTGILGELTDAQGGFQPCAPAADNFTTFYAGANPPSFQVTINGANHMSFLDDVAGCGLTCAFCNAATAPQDQVLGLARSYVVAFYERHLRGDAAYDTYLTGAEAQMRYVTPGLATIVSK